MMVWYSGDCIGASGGLMVVIGTVVMRWLK